MTRIEVIEDDGQLARLWWVLLLTGIAWILVAVLVLGFDPTTPATIGYVTGFVLIAAGVTEFVAIGVVEGWKWLHAVLGGLFVLGGVLALTSPFQTFGILALLIGWYLVFKGIVDIVVSAVYREVLPLWGLALAAGIAEVVIGVWALGYPGRSAWLLVLWIGIGALVRGITEIVLAFQLRGARTA
jgi:uncharacterized membrane protein HdeD (DUF308 family)